MRLSADRRHLLWRAVASAVFIPLAFFVGDVLVGGNATPIFTVFGAASILLFARFSGDRRDQTRDYAGLAVAGFVTISAGTLLAHPMWLAAVSMFIVGAVVTLAGTLSLAAAGAGRAVLLTFILPLIVPADLSELPARLLGWTIALVVCLPPAILLSPSRDARTLRRRIGAACRGIAGALHAIREGADDIAARVRSVAEEVDGLRAIVETPATRPIGTSTRSRSLIRSASLVESASELLTDRSSVDSGTWDVAEATLLADSARVLESSAATLTQSGASPTDDGSWEGTQSRLDAYIASAIRDHRGLDGDRAAWLTAVVMTTLAIERTLDPGASARGHARRLPPLGRVLRAHLTLESATLRASIRVGLGLAVAVVAAESLPLENAFWVVLATLSALSTNRIGTSTSAVQAVLGTVIGFAGSVLLLAIVGTSPVVLWLLLPAAVLLACFAPAAISFTAGQAAFTLFVVIVFDIANPTISRIGIARVEDVIVGSLIAVLVSASLWPSGVGRAAEAAAHAALRASADYLARTVAALVRGTEVTTDELDAVSVSVLRANDARRQYRVEHGVDSGRLGRLVAADDLVLCLLHAGDEILALGPTAAPGSMAASRAALDGTLERVLHGMPPSAMEAMTDDEVRLAFIGRLQDEATDADADEATRLATAWIWLRQVQRFLRRHDLASVDAAS
jgi:uncharacterized membrane protein YccC